MSLLPHIELETAPNPTASVIWLHGLGADGNDFAPIVPELGLATDTAIRFIFPHAPSISVTINNGMVMPAWYNILDMSIDRKVDTPQLKQSAAKIIDFIENEISRGIASDKIIVAGFSQGGAVAFEVALSFPKKLAGLLAMSTYFATRDSIDWNPVNQAIPVEIHHGSRDPVVPPALGQASFELLKSKNYSVNLKNYPMEHAVCHQQIGDIGKWIEEVLS
jgi:phospholipase/carboxylesterase